MQTTIAQVFGGLDRSLVGMTYALSIIGATSSVMSAPLQVALTHRPLPNGEPARPEVADALAQAGHCVTLVRDDLPDPDRFDLLWIHGNANWYPGIRRQLAVHRQAGGRRPLVVLWHAEPLPLPEGAPFPRPRLHLREIAKILLRDARATDPFTNARRLGQLARARLYDVLVVSTPSRQAYLAEHGIRSSMVPMGYHPSCGRDLAIERDIDVLFLGALDVPRRRRLITRLRAAKVRIEAMGSWYATDTWGESRTRLLNRTRVLLNIQRYPGELSGQRMLLGMANKALVISEPIHMPGPYVPGQHWVQASIDDMPATIAHYLADEHERRTIAEAGHDLVVNHLRLEQSVAEILALADQARS
jgi:hypothetical protein